MEEKRSIYYWDYNNFGDQLNALINDRLCNGSLEFDQFDNCDLFAIGSILERLISKGDIGKKDREIRKKADKEKPVHIWGSGLLYETDPSINALVRKMVFHALRGELTRKTMEKICDRKIRCVLADPGLLSPLLVKPAEEKKYHIGLISNCKEENEEIYKRVEEHYPDCIRISAAQDPKIVLKMISECEYIISSSLHGIICADAYQIPNCWVIGTDLVRGKGYKFHDYFSSFGKDRAPFELRKDGFPSLEKDFDLSYEKYDQVRAKQIELIHAFPFEVSEEFAEACDRKEFYRRIDDFPKTLTDERYIEICKAKIEQPDVSIIIPVYNVEEYIDACLESLLRQTYENIEIICVDDGSTDSSLEKLMKYQTEERISIYSKRNSGQSSARNLGLLKARGEYVYCIDGDDLLEENAISVLKDAIEKNDADLIFFNGGSFYDEEDASLKKKISAHDCYFLKDYSDIKDGEDLFDRMIENNEYKCATTRQFYKKEFLFKNDMFFHYGVYHEDEIFTSTVLLKAKKVFFLKDKLYKRRIRNDSTMTVKVTDRHILGDFYTYLTLDRYLHTMELKDETRINLLNIMKEKLSRGKRRYRKLEEKQKDFYLDLPEEKKILFEALIVDKQHEDLLKKNTQMKKQIDTLENENKKLRFDLDKVHASLSFKIGRILTYLPRKIRDLLKGKK